MKIWKQATVAGMVVILAVVAYVYGWPLVSPADSRQTAGEGKQKQATRVVVAKAVMVPERTSIKAVGTGSAIQSVTLYPPTSGEVVAVNLSPDQAVSKGDVLVTLDRRSERLAVELANVRLKNARTLVQRYERTGRSGAVAASTVDEGRAAVEEARIELRQAEVALADRQVVAPFDGHVGSTDVDVGDRIGPSDAITTLDDRSDIRVTFDVPEAFLSRVAVGQPITVSTWSERDLRIEGEIIDVGSRVDPDSRSFIARARVPNDDDRLRPGMSFAVGVDIEGRERPRVPEVAVQWAGDGAYLWAVRDGKAERIAVRIVERQEGTVLLDAPIEEGETIVVEGIQRMRPGMTVEAVGDPGTAGDTAADTAPPSPASTNGG